MLLSVHVCTQNMENTVMKVHHDVHACTHNMENTVIKGHHDAVYVCTQNMENIVIKVHDVQCNKSAPSCSIFHVV